MASEASTEIETRLFINGEFRPASDGGTFPLKSPATLETVALVSEASVEDTNDAVAAAQAAFPAWSSLSPHDRGAYMLKLADLILESEKELAYLEAISMGRPISEYWDAKAAAEKLQYFASCGWHGQGQTSLNTPGFINMTLRQPYGVVAAIIPWNVPVNFFINKVAPAIAAGNTVVIKSSEKAPLTSAKVAHLIHRAGFPPGVINVLSVITFTGSGRTGRLIQKAAANSNLKNVIFELGGKSPTVIFPDADLEKAAKESAYSIQMNSGQVCMANSRIYVHTSIADQFIPLFKANFQSVSMGDPTKPCVNHGPQADETQFNIVKRYIELGKKDGELILGGGDVPDQKGYFIPPTIFANTPESSQIMKEEIFGPVVNINVFETEAEVIKMVNSSDFGLYAAVYTRDVNRAMRFATSMEAGTVGINCTSPTGAFDMPFGGYKASGIGREGIHHSLDNYLETKTVHLRVEGL
ncbi:Aldehyde/histidinol dehydrogenase [Aspergillus pseudonomiae]|uniref:aldehyde dehydrogenase (NAD(+)) n=1 Tax=Aspergillus pseudonomiae TaxID=1506151 RepID=A0A5N7DJA6_9EURO|nr:Aldehyde/histidinol dehydrogenase [Aspergillus pseudonomiae]KAE8406520.1 Aldehyde/histidinol dehydrogenase [Aspergillus pseudonomiae]